VLLVLDQGKRRVSGAREGLLRARLDEVNLRLRLDVEILTRRFPSAVRLDPLDTGNATAGGRFTHDDFAELT
jgi:hypothetical protein